MFANRIGSSTNCSIWLPETLPPSSARAVLRHRLRCCNTSLFGAFGVFTSHKAQHGQITFYRWISAPERMKSTDADATTGFDAKRLPITTDPV